MQREPEEWREQTQRERQVVETILLADFPGRDEVGKQLRGARVRDDCECGCGSFAVEQRQGMPSAPESGALLNVEGEDDNGTLVGLFIMVREGYVEYVECYGLARSPVSLPLPKSLRLTTQFRVSSTLTRSLPHERTILEGDRRA
jgi:hypothetical protein